MTNRGKWPSRWLVVLGALAAVVVGWAAAERQRADELWCVRTPSGLVVAAEVDGTPIPLAVELQTQDTGGDVVIVAHHRAATIVDRAFKLLGMSRDPSTWYRNTGSTRADSSGRTWEQLRHVSFDVGVGPILDPFWKYTYVGDPGAAR